MKGTEVACECHHRVEPYAQAYRMGDSAFLGPKNGPQLEYCLSVAIRTLGLK